MTPKDVAPPRQTWVEHLKDLGDRELTELAGDYCWITEKNHPEEMQEFRRRREAILAECERRGLKEAAKLCRPSAGLAGE